MSLDNHQQSPTSNLDAEEQWRAHPEGTDVRGVSAFGLYFLLETPAGECFDGSLSVGVTGPPPGDSAPHSPSVVLGYTGDSGARLTNQLLRPEDARELAGQPTVAADQAAKLHDEVWTPEVNAAAMARLVRVVLPGLTVEQLVAGGLTEDQVRELRKELEGTE